MLLRNKMRKHVELEGGFIDEKIKKQRHKRRCFEEKKKRDKFI